MSFGAIQCHAVSQSAKDYQGFSGERLPALWIDDDFLNNEKLEFDYEKFELIDTGIKYLNPKHFSVKSFVEYCRFSKE